MKKIVLKFSLFLFTVTGLVLQSYAQIEAVPVSYYGTWDRGGFIDDYGDPKYDYVKGIEVNIKWNQVQPTVDGGYDFSKFKKALVNAASHNLLVKMSINVGPEAPAWIYENGVPLVDVKSNKPKNDNLTNCPDYLHHVYKKYYFKLIEDFSLFLRSQPKELFESIGFVQVKTGATGDEEPFKGEPKDKDFEISKKEWQDFRLEAFETYKKYFNDVPDRRIVLTFNNVDEKKYPEAYNWVMDKINPEVGFGIKGGAYNRGHHLTGELSFKEQWLPYLVNPKGMKLFSASEMDQSWRKPIFNINRELGFYWAAWSGINTGVSSTNVSVSAVKYSNSHPKIRDIFKMFNTYAQQVYPAKATAAASVFHEGLNSMNVKKFPENIYGKASKGNLERYTAICKAYAKRGAKMDDLNAASAGQVRQREAQTGYNDAGWDIEEGNYERFLTQIEPDSTSIGLFRVRGELNKKSSKYDRFARSFENATGKNTMYFKFHDEMFANSKPKNLIFTITWLDKHKGSTWALKYNNGKKITTALGLKGQGDNIWKSVKVEVSDMLLDHSGALNSDFTLVNTDEMDDVFNGIEVDIER